jgi:hypothetical protein
VDPRRTLRLLWGVKLDHMRWTTDATPTPRPTRALLARGPVNTRRRSTEIFNQVSGAMHLASRRNGNRGVSIP